MTPSYLDEYAEDALLSLRVAKKEMSHLAYSQQTLFSQTIDLDWVDSLEADEQKSEKNDAFVGRFGRLQDFIGEKLIPRFARLLGENPKSMLDVLAYAERMTWMENAEMFIATRKLRNLLVHEYMTDKQLFLDSLLSANTATNQLFGVVQSIKHEAKKISLI